MHDTPASILLGENRRYCFLEDARLRHGVTRGFARVAKSGRSYAYVVTEVRVKEPFQQINLPKIHGNQACLWFLCTRAAIALTYVWYMHKLQRKCFWGEGKQTKSGHRPLPERRSTPVDKKNANLSSMQIYSSRLHLASLTPEIKCCTGCGSFCSSDQPSWICGRCGGKQCLQLQPEE